MNSFLVMFAVMMMSKVGDAKCDFEAVFNFGDSNSDTGGYSSAFPPLNPPYGLTYFRKPAGRVSDGRLIIDFLAQAMGVPFLSPYLKSIGSDFRHGANFATVSSTVRRPNDTQNSPFFLGVQLNQLKELKLIVDEHHSSDLNPPFIGIGTRLPQPDIFGKSIYTFYIGQNDFTRNLQSGRIIDMNILREVVSDIASTIKEIYKLGGRTFLVLNLAPVGCYPILLVQSRNASDLDPSGCLISCNKAVDEYNAMLKSEIEDARLQLPEADLIHVDTHAILLRIFKDPASYGIEYATRACCGYGGGPYNFKPDVFCGFSGMVGGQTVTTSVCSDPGKYVNWDGLHLTEAANKIVANAILHGSYLDPPFPISHYCAIHPIV